MRNVSDSSCVCVWFILPGSPCIFPAGYPHPCAAPAGGKNLGHPLPPGRFLRIGPPGLPVWFVVEGLYISIPTSPRMAPSRLLVLGSSFFSKIRPPPYQKKSEGKKRKSLPLYEREATKESSRAADHAHKRSRQLPSAHTKPGRKAAPSPHTRTHSVLRVHVLHYIRRLAPERSAQAGNNIGGHRVTL